PSCEHVHSAEKTGYIGERIVYQGHVAWTEHVDRLPWCALQGVDIDPVGAVGHYIHAVEPDKQTLDGRSGALQVRGSFVRAGVVVRDASVCVCETALIGDEYAGRNGRGIVVGLRRVARRDQENREEKQGREAAYVQGIHGRSEMFRVK